MSTGAAGSLARSRRLGGGSSIGSSSSGFFLGADKKVLLSPQRRRDSRGGGGGGVMVVYAAKGRNARLAGRDRKAQQREDKKMLDGRDAAAAERSSQSTAATTMTQRESGLKYSKRGKVSSQPGQVSKAALKRIREVRRSGGGAMYCRHLIHGRLVVHLRIERGRDG